MGVPGDDGKYFHWLICIHNQRFYVSSLLWAARWMCAMILACVRKPDAKNLYCLPDKEYTPFPVTCMPR